MVGRGYPSSRLVYRKGVLVSLDDRQHSSAGGIGNLDDRIRWTSSSGGGKVVENLQTSVVGRRRESLTSSTFAVGSSTSFLQNSSSAPVAAVVVANPNRRRSRSHVIEPTSAPSIASARRTPEPHMNSDQELQLNSEHPQFTPASGQRTTETTTSSATSCSPFKPQRRISILGFQTSRTSTSSSQQATIMANPSHHQHHRNSIPANNNNNNNIVNKPKEFVPSFVLVDACKANNERKIRELVRRLTPFSCEDVDPIVNFQDSCGRTALSYACSSGNVMIIDELSKLRRLDPNLGDNENNTPLHYAAQAGHSETVDLLLSRFDGNIDPNCRNSTGLTPLMKAALQGRTRCAKSLISAGAVANLRDYSRGLTAAEWARLCGRHICAEVIIRCAKDNYQNPHSPPADFPRSQHHHQQQQHHRGLPVSQSALELKKLGSEESSAYYHLYAGRNTISGGSWLKNKIKKALGASSSNLTSRNTTTTSSSNNNYEGPRRESFALLANLTGPTICASSLLLPSIKPLIEQQKPRLSRKLTIPVLQVTPVKR